MKILISGGTGFIGTELTRSLLSDGHQVLILTRHPQIAPRTPMDARVRYVGWQELVSPAGGELLSGVDAVVNLAGESIGAERWNRQRKDLILSSRQKAGSLLAEACSHANPKPKVFIQASAVGYYGPGGVDAPVTEASPEGSDYQAEVCKAWEASTLPVEQLGVRRCIIRTAGVVLSKDEGALPRMLLPFRLFAGGPLGSGRQGFSWIHKADEVAAIRFLIENERARGAFNLCSPKPLSNADFGRLIARVMKRPYWLPAPAFALRLLLGEMSTLVLEGTFMLPKRLQELGFRFRFENAEDALQDLLKPA